MTKDYQFLVGQRFSVEGIIYVVRELTAAVEEADDDIYVEAHTPEELESTRTFRLSDVIEWLLVDEEIVLFSPNYLAAI